MRKEKFDEQLNTWLGKDIGEYISKQGPPSNVFPMPGSPQKIYTWIFGGGTVAQKRVNFIGQPDGVLAYEQVCKLSFVVLDANNEINTYNYTGNWCY